MSIELISQSITATDGVTLVAYTAGDSQKPALVFVHGYPDNHHIWLPLMQHIVKDHFIVAYDVRGAGRSDVPQHVSQYQLAQLSDDLWQVTQHILGDKPFHVIGHDWGSIQTWESACQERFRDKMRSFTSISGPCLDHVGHLVKDPEVSLLKKANQLMRSWYIYAFQLPVIPHILWRRLAPQWHRVSKLPQDTLRLDDAIHGMNLYKANIAQRQIKPRDMHTVCPVHVIILTEDSFVTPVLYEDVEKWGADLTRDELALTHWSIYTHPEQVAQCILAYLARI